MAETICACSEGITDITYKEEQCTNYEVHSYFLIYLFIHLQKIKNACLFEEMLNAAKSALLPLCVHLSCFSFS